MLASQKSHHNRILGTKYSWLTELFTIIWQRFDDKIATEQLTAEA